MCTTFWSRKYTYLTILAAFGSFLPSYPKKASSSVILGRTILLVACGSSNEVVSRYGRPHPHDVQGHLLFLAGNNVNYKITDLTSRKTVFSPGW
jgi:hypothetical protein